MWHHGWKLEWIDVVVTLGDDRDNSIYYNSYFDDIMIFDFDYWAIF